MTQTINHILVPVDFSAHSERAVQYATTVANRFGARLQLLHVVEDPFVTGAWSSEVYVPNMPELLGKLTNAAQQRIAELKERLATHGFVVETDVVTGQPARTIVEHATSGGFDLIVMGTHGRTGLSHVFMGSIAERVVQKAPCPVLTVHEGNRAAIKTTSGEAMAVA